MDRNNYIEVHPTQAQVAKISYHHPSKCFPSTSILAFSYNVLCREDINSIYHFERIPGNIPGVYISLESELIRYIMYRVNPETKFHITTHQNVSPQLQYLLFRIMCLFSEKWVCK
jgi:hypothetical protein